MAVCYSYQRFSSRLQAKGHSVKRQTEMLMEWLARHPEHTLDDKLRIDAGVSGAFGKNLSQGALGDFLKEIKAGRIKKGSLLVVESIDRLGRQPVGDMLELVRQILLADVGIVTLNPERQLCKADKDTPLVLMEIIFYSARAREESEVKMERLARKWDWRRQQAIEHNKPTGNYCPGWLELKDGKFVPIKERVKVVRKIYKMACDGEGAGRIAKILNVEGVESLGRSKTWSKNYVRYCLTCRAVLGEYVPHTKRAYGPRVPTTTILENYYPAIIPADLFHRTQRVLKDRTTRGTRVSTHECRNLFAGLVQTNGSNWRLVDKGKHGKADWRLQAKSDADGLTHHGTIRYPLFEKCLLRYLLEVDLPTDRPASPIADQLAGARGELITTDQQLAKIAKALETADDVEALVKTARRLEQRRQEQLDHIAHLEREATREQATPLAEAKTLAAALQADNSTANRIKIRQVLADAIEGIEIQKNGKSATAIVKLGGLDFSHEIRIDDKWLTEGCPKRVDPRKLVAIGKSVTYRYNYRRHQ